MRISVVVPALNEEAVLPATLASLQRQPPHEIILADGGSSDATRELASAVGARVVISPKGRAIQMNAGAVAATGDVLLFLHADCALEDGALSDAHRMLRRGNAAGGCFRMAIPHANPLYRCIAWCATARVKLFGIAYGDQGIFVRRDIFVKLGGFPNLRFMEDVWFSLRLRKTGRIVVADKRIFVSARRWERSGIIRQTLRNWTLTALAAAGVHPDRLAQYYPLVR